MVTVYEVPGVTEIFLCKTAPPPPPPPAPLLLLLFPPEPPPATKNNSTDEQLDGAVNVPVDVNICVF
jgi:hypothetical protein